jgi:tetratricopeptide (TPR) repeat protein
VISVAVVALGLVSAPARAQVDPKAALLERDGFRLLEAGEARRAADAFREALKADPRNPSLLIGAGTAAFLDRRDADAKRALEQALVLDPQSQDARRILGHVLRRQGDLPGAIRVYAEIDGEPAAAQTLARWRRELELHDRMWQAVGERFTVSFEGPAEAHLAERALQSLDRAYWRVGDLLGAAYPLSPVPVILYTREQFRDITRSPTWAAAAYDGIIRVPMRGALESPAELDRVLAHEFTHSVVRTLAATGVPTWLNEGLAAALESDDLGWAEERIEAAGGIVPLARLAYSFGQFNAADAALAYASSAIAVRTMLDEAGGFAVATLLRDLGAGADLEAAFTRRMQRSLESFERGQR